MSHTSQSTVLSTPPLTGIPGLMQNWKSDILSGFLVFLIALPLCLGIAMASGFPPMAGIITAIIGGLLVSRLSGSYVTINGPAAGLIVVILDSVQELGKGDAMAGYKYTLAAIVIASIFQTVMGISKAGRLSAFFPSGVVHGMLAAIGIIIMGKQIHVMLGVKPDAGTLIETIAAIPNSILNLNPEIALIGGAGLIILILWNIANNRYLKMIPAPIVVVILGIALGQYFDLDHEHVAYHDFTIGPKFLVAIPDNFLAGFYFPDFSRAGELVFWEQVVTICLVGSLESLLSAAAVDKLDPYKRYSDLNRDLTAVGIGNTLSGLVGGLPMIAEIVRSSANINNGAKTSWANFFHSLFLLLFVGLVPGLIHEIPLASLASLLVFTGFRLAAPHTFIKTLEIGYEQLVIFVATIIGVLATDLLVGVAIGMATELLIHIIRSLNWNEAFRLYFKIEQTSEDTYTIHINGAAFFANYLALKSGLARLPDGKKLIFDFSSASSVDHTVMEFIHEYSEDYARRGGTCTTHGLDRHNATSEHHLAARTLKRRSTD
jgi:MFS superfamily sulfate permease-like transporter